MKEAKDFWNDLKENAEMLKELNKILAAADIKSEEEKIEAIAAFAKEKGYEVDEEELALAKAESRTEELPMSDLEKVSGGSDDRETACFLDYLCVGIWNNCNITNECDEGLWFCKESVSTGDCNKALTAQKACSGIFWPSCDELINAD